MRSAASKLALCVEIVVFTMMMVATGLALATLEADQPGFYSSVFHVLAFGIPSLFVVAVLISTARRMIRRAHAAPATHVSDPAPKSA